MRRKQRGSGKKVFFNASVILAGLYSPKGGSARLLNEVKSRRLKGLISEVVFDEVVRNCERIGLKKGVAERKVLEIFGKVAKAPEKRKVNRYKKMVIDEGDAHVIASSFELGADYLVSLDNKHILVLKGGFRDLEICTPGELLEVY